MFFYKRKIGIELFLFFLFIFPLYATDNLRQADIRNISTGYNGVTQSSFFNPSLITGTGKKSLQLHYLNRYGLKEIGSLNGSFIYPNPILTTAIHISSFGYDAYNEHLLRFSVGKQLHQYWRLGVAIHYSILQTELYDEKPSRLSTDIGCIYQPIDDFLIGLLLMNAPSVSIRSDYVDLHSFPGHSLWIGFQWNIVNNLLLMGSIGTTWEYPITGNLGIEYTLFNSFFIRSGMQLKPLLPSGGIGYDFPLFSLDIAVIPHPVLGMSTGIGLSFHF